MKTGFLAVALGLAAMSQAATAGGISFDLPRLTFPSDAGATTRDCATPHSGADCARNG